MSKKGKKYYVVWVGARPGIYENWDEARAQVAGYPGAKYKSFPTRVEAEAAFKDNPARHIVSKTGQQAVAAQSKEIIRESISVDAACSGNPGVMEYQGVHTGTGQQIFYQKFHLGTNNIGEFLAIVHALALLDKQGKHQMPIYTDSRNALAWVRNKKCKTTLPRNAQTEQLWQLIERAEKWLQTHEWKNPILKWNTKAWGEIPADFGRK